MAAAFKPPLKQTERQHILRDLVRGVQDTWRDSGGKGKGTWYAKDDKDRNGDLVQLLLTMFEQTGVKPPAARTIRRALQQVNNLKLDC